jgi:hypothetical protein
VSEPSQPSWPRSIAGRFVRQNLERFIVIVVWISVLVLIARQIPQSIGPEAAFFAAYLLVAYLLWSYASQTVSEFWLLMAISRHYKGIVKRLNTTKDVTRTALLSTHDLVRTNMITFVTRSQNFPVGDLFEEKLKQSIDIFFYGTGLAVLSEKPDYYSVSEQRQIEIEEEEDLHEYDEQKISEAEEEEYRGKVVYFDLDQVRLFLMYLGDRIFRKSGYHEFWAFKYRINLVDYLNFFDHWNKMLSGSSNAAASKAAERAAEEVRRFYTENRRRLEVKSERIWSLTSSLVVAVLSALLGFLIGRL